VKKRFFKCHDENLLLAFAGTRGKFSVVLIFILVIENSDATMKILMVAATGICWHAW